MTRMTYVKLFIALTKKRIDGQSSKTHLEEGSRSFGPCREVGLSLEVLSQIRCVTV